MDFSKKRGDGDEMSDDDTVSAQLANRIHMSHGARLERYKYGKMGYKIDFFCARAFPLLFAGNCWIFFINFYLIFSVQHHLLVILSDAMMEASADVTRITIFFIIFVFHC